jgi:hypothetical protein
VATVTGYTAARMKAIEDGTVIDGDVVGDNLILTRHDGATINAGNVRGPQGVTGPQGPAGTPGTPSDGSVTTAKLVDGSVTNPKLADGAVNSAKIQDGSIQPWDLVDGVAPVFATTVGGLGAGVQGKRGVLRIGPGPYQYVPVVYDPALGKWVSENLLSASGLIGVSIANGVAYNVAVLWERQNDFYNAGLRLYVKGVGGIYCDDPDADGSGRTNVPLRVMCYEASTGNDVLQGLGGVGNIAMAITSGWFNFGELGWALVPLGTGRHFVYIIVQAVANWFAGGTHTVQATATVYGRWAG